MRLGVLRHTADVTVDAQADHDRQVREARLAAARRQANWTEVNHVDLVRRGPYLVHAETDQLYIVRRGHVFAPSSAAIEYVAPDAPMTYTVNEADEVVFLERPGSPSTWSEIVARKATRR